jgi:hypothetical protein
MMTLAIYYLPLWLLHLSVSVCLSSFSFTSSLTVGYSLDSNARIEVWFPFSPLSAGLLLTILTFAILVVPIGLVYSIHDPTEVAISKMIDASQRMITMNSQGELGGMSHPLKRHLALQIKTPETAPRDAEKLERLLKAKRRQKEEAMHIEDTQRLVAEIEMLKVLLYLVRRTSSRNRS